MSKKNTISWLNILFGVVSVSGNAYLFYLFAFTDYMKKNPDNTLIAPLITFVMGTGLKSIYAFAVNVVCETPEETNRETNDMKHTLDFVTAFTFFGYVSQVLTGKDIAFLILIIGCTTILAITFLNVNTMNRIKEIKKRQKRGK